MRTDKRTDLTKLIAAFLNSANEPRNPSLLRCCALSSRKYYTAFMQAVKEDFLDLSIQRKVPEDLNLPLPCLQQHIMRPILHPLNIIHIRPSYFNIFSSSPCRPRGV